VISSLDRAGVEEGEEAVDEAAGDQVGGGGPAEGDG